MSRPPVALDIECYPDFLMVGFLGINKPTFKYFELYEGHPFDREGVIGLLRQVQIITFNGRNYDIPMLLLALSGRTNKALKQASDLIITQGLKPWDIEREYQVKTPSYIDHIDLIEVAPGTASLKIYGGRIHAPKMQDLPYEHDENILPDRRLPLIEYNRNDLETTVLLYQKLLPQIELRVSMSEQYGIDLRSKSDAQIAEALIKQEVEKLKGERVFRPDIATGTKYLFNPPKFLRYQTQVMRDVFRMVCESSFVVGLKGSIEMPDSLSNFRVRIGDSEYRMGIGGLHSSEESVAHHTDDETVLVDADVTSFYPATILNTGLFPSNMGEDFATVYKSIVERRVRSKHRMQEIETELALLRKELSKSHE